MLWLLLLSSKCFSKEKKLSSCKKIKVDWKLTVSNIFVSSIQFHKHSTAVASCCWCHSITVPSCWSATVCSVEDVTPPMSAPDENVTHSVLADDIATPFFVSYQDLVFFSNIVHWGHRTIIISPWWGCPSITCSVLRMSFEPLAL